MPMPLLLCMERIAEGGILHALATDYVRAFLLLISLRARLGDMISARAFACEILYAFPSVSCTMDNEGR